MSEVTQPAKQPRLLALTPEYQEDNHRVYLDAIEAALTGASSDGIRNIALTGSYGSGKSSILQQVAKNRVNKVIQISLSTLGIEDIDSGDSAAQSKTNRIQKEIVKQFLYSEDPARAPGSRFRRISRLNFWRELAMALLVGVVAAFVSLIAGWTDKLILLVKPYVSASIEPALPLITVGAVSFVASAFALALRYLTHHRLRIEKVTAGPATISLSDDSTSFFDRYLDEIIYFFDVTKYDVVIFEDIDRFDDPHIFETLRALNTLLNGARQLKGRSIRFVYAIKDSIFDELGLRAAREEGAKPLENDTAHADVADVELARANRTKFFDIVIPVVPFVTHLSARDVMGEVMREIQHEITDDLIDLAARHLADMRFIKNVRNEFLIFRQKVLPRAAEGSEHDETLELSENSLFAMMLYKGTHLSDFESIRLGTSKLDLLYQASRKLVTENVSVLDAQARDLRRRIAWPDTVESRSARLGTALAEHLKRAAKMVKVVRTTETYSVSFAGQRWTEQDLSTVDFWTRFVADDGPITVIVPGFSPPGWGNVFNVELVFSRNDAAKALGEPLSLDEWQAEDRAELPERLDEILREREFLLHADMGDLIARRDLKVSHDGEKSALADLSEETLGSVLAQKLVSAGYINRNFTLYSSTYYGERVSTRARNFLMHNVDRNVSDFHFALKPQDVDAVLAERGESVLGERGTYNIAVFDRLLQSRDTRADLLVESMTTFGETEREFLGAYLTGGQHEAALINRMAGRSPQIFSYLVGEAEVTEPVRVQLVAAALLNINSKLNYDVGTAVKQYFEVNYPFLTPFIDRNTNEETAQRITALLEEMDALLDSLRPLGPEVRRAVVTKSRYVITRDNLLVAIGDEASLALDAIRNRDKFVYDHVLADSAAYLEALNAEEAIIDANDHFAEIIEDVVEHARGLLPTAVSRAAKECVIAELEDVSAVAWPTLALNRRFPATFSNVTAYISEVGSVDENLGTLLAESRAILEAPDDENAKQTLAATILAARSPLASPELRTDLVTSLGLDAFIPTTAIPSESGPLLGLLLRDRIIGDNKTSFALTLKQDWPTREFAISQSNEFPNYMTPTEVPVHDVANILRSRAVPTKVKQNIVERAADYTAGADGVALQAVADYAQSSEMPLPLPEIARHASAGVPSQLVIATFHPHLDAIGLDQIVPILRSLSGPYPDITERNGKHPKLPNTRADLALVERLKSLGVVNSYKVDDEITVNMKRPTDQ